MDTGGAEHERVLLEQRQGLAQRRPVIADVHESGYAVGDRTRDGGLAVVIEVLEIEMTV
jgi:hypothetical protein